MQKPVDWLYGFFSKKGKIPGKNRDGQLKADIFDSTLIDSFGLVELISEIESTFNFELKAEDIQDQRFRTIQGLAEIIEARLNDSK